MTSLVEALVNRPPAVLLLANDLPGLGGVQRIRDLRRLSPATKVVLLARFTSEQEELDALRMGARGYCGPVETEVLLKLIEKVREGEVWAARKTIGALLEEFFEVGVEPQAAQNAEMQRHIDQLTERERQIMLLLASGASNKEIANALALSVSTVKAHLTRVFRKLGQPDRVRLALYAAALGRIPLTAMSGL